MGSSRSLGLDIGTSAVRAAEISIGRDGPRLDRFAQVALPHGAVSGGEVLQPDVVRAAIKKLRAVGKFKNTSVAIGVGNQRVVVRQLDLPWMPATELRSALVFQVQDLLPIPVEDALLDYHPIAEFVGDGGARMIRAMLVAADAAMVDRSVEVVRSAGLRPVVVDLTTFALLRAAVAQQGGGPNYDAEEYEAIVDIGSTITNIVVHAGGVPRFVRLLTLGGEDITEALAERLGIARDDAEERKCGATPPSAESGAGPGEAPNMAVPAQGDPAFAGRALESAAATLVDEVRGSLDYYRAQPGARPLSRVVLSGGGALAPGLLDQLGAATRLPVQRDGIMAVVAQGGGLSADLAERAAPFAAVPVGLALRMAS